MYDKSSGTASLGESAFVDAFPVSFGDLVTTTITEAIKISADVDAFLRLGLDEDKVSVTGLNGGSSITIGALITTKGTVSLG